jgi:hypothetical protein
VEKAGCHGVYPGSSCSLRKETGILESFISRLSHAPWRKQETMRQETVVRWLYWAEVRLPEIGSVVRYDISIRGEFSVFLLWVRSCFPLHTPLQPVTTLSDYYTWKQASGDLIHFRKCFLNYLLVAIRVRHKGMSHTSSFLKLVPFGIEIKFYCSRPRSCCSYFRLQGCKIIPLPGTRLRIIAPGISHQGINSELCVLQAK